MYNKNKGIWQSQSYDEADKMWCVSPEHRNDPRALFMRADMLFSNIRDGADNANAVYWMEQAAKGNHLQAVRSMGDMYLHGFGVGKDRKLAIYWYQKAAELGDMEACDILESLLRKKTKPKPEDGEKAVQRPKAKKGNKRLVIILVALVVLVGVVAAVLFLTESSDEKIDGIQVHEDTDLVECEDQVEFNNNLRDIMDQFDSEDVKTGKEPTKRLLVKYEGDSLDLSQFPAAKVLCDTENYLVIQFNDANLSVECMESLLENPNVIFVEEDGYRFYNSILNTAGKEVTTISANASGYLSWGVTFLELDVLAKWIATQQTTPVTVAVIDSGTMEAPEFAGRVLDGINLAEGGTGKYDDNGHGTHVGSTVLDCTRGLDVSVLPIRVLNSDGVCSNSLLVEGIKYAAGSDAQVINMSLGESERSIPNGGSCSSTSIDYYLNDAIAQGKIVVLAAGNEADSADHRCPSHLDAPIVVGACDQNGDYTDFTNYGNSVDFSAPGMDITSYGTDLELCTWPGTSMAAPHISALAAMLRLYLPDRTPQQIYKYIADYSVLPGDPMYYGEGIPAASHFAGD